MHTHHCPKKPLFTVPATDPLHRTLCFLAFVCPSIPSRRRNVNSARNVSTVHDVEVQTVEQATQQSFEYTFIRVVCNAFRFEGLSCAHMVLSLEAWHCRFESTNSGVLRSPVGSDASARLSERGVHSGTAPKSRQIFLSRLKDFVFSNASADVHLLDYIDVQTVEILHFKPLFNCGCLGCFSVPNSAPYEHSSTSAA